MQNKHISWKVVLATLLVSTGVQAQEADLLEVETKTPTEETTLESLADFSAGVSQKKTVDFPPRSSLDSMELAPLPGIYETNVNGPQPMAESVSANDTPSEQLLGRLTPEVFQEMAELERDKAYLKLLAEKEDVKNDLERKRAQYRQDRLNEIADREKIIRERILWWQEQEKLRQELEKERQEAEDVKNQMAEAEALKAQLEAEALALKNREEEKKGQSLEEEEEDVSETPVANSYELVTVKGTRGNLVAKVKNTATNEVSSVQVGDNLNGEVITAITSDNVIIDRNGAEYFVKFPN